MRRSTDLVILPFFSSYMQLILHVSSPPCDVQTPSASKIIVDIEYPMGRSPHKGYPLIFLDPSVLDDNVSLRSRYYVSSFKK